jgi:uncharacterized tellurite resistance protein B-like protein
MKNVNLYFWDNTVNEKFNKVLWKHCHTTDLKAFEEKSNVRNIQKKSIYKHTPSKALNLLEISKQAQRKAFDIKAISSKVKKHLNRVG